MVMRYPVIKGVSFSLIPHPFWCQYQLLLSLQKAIKQASRLFQEEMEASQQMKQKIGLDLLQWLVIEWSVQAHMELCFAACHKDNFQSSLKCSEHSPPPIMNQLLPSQPASEGAGQMFRLSVLSLPPQKDPWSRERREECVPTQRTTQWITVTGKYNPVFIFVASV